MKGEKGHLNELVMEQILSSYSPHEREMRRYGRPSIGSGLVFPVQEDKVIIEPFDIPQEWARIAAIDFGYDHPTAVVWMAWDKDEDVYYLYDCHRMSKATPQIHSGYIKTRPNWIPMVFPHDGNRKDSMGNPGLADQYRSHGINMLLDNFTNPPALGEKKGGNSIETGIMAMLQSIENDRFKVFSKLSDWFEEIRMYHRKAGKIVLVRDDLMSAKRYAFQSMERFGMSVGEEDWSKEIEYKNMGIV